MSAKQFLKEFAIYFCLMFVVNIVVIYMWNLIFHSAGSIDWPRSIVFPVFWAIGLPIVNATIINKTNK